LSDGFTQLISLLITKIKYYTGTNDSQG